ncbi:MAG: C40 family peptidase [Ginsengibacter sp.]
MRFLSAVSMISLIIFASSCTSTRKSTTTPATTGSANAMDIRSSVVIKKKVPAITIQTKNTPASEVVKFAETLLGVRYKYGSSDKKNGFDCSGFITYVFNRFDIKVPRISSDFTNAGREILLKDSRPGDLILFTGSDAKSGVVGHMGIITKNNNGWVEFIHASTSRGVMISGMNSYFIPRYVKTNRIFNK